MIHQKIGIVMMIILFQGCVSNQELRYLQGVEQGVVYPAQHPEAYILQEGDILAISIRSMNPEVNAIFATSSSANAAPVAAQSGGDVYFMTGYSVDEQGEIVLPFIGSVDIEGKTLPQARVHIDSLVSRMFTNYFLEVKMGGLRYTALGEFSRPGKQVLMQNRATIFEAVAQSGDLTMLAERDHLQIIRQTPEGTKTFELSLLDDQIFKSPGYFIQPNDIIYAPPLPQKSLGIGVTGAQTLTTLVSAFSGTLALILTIANLNL